MTPGLGYPPASSHDPYNPRTKNVDEGLKRQGLSGSALSGLGHLGDGYAREALQKKFKRARETAAEADAAAELAGRNPTQKTVAKAAAAKRVADDAASELASLLQVAEPSKDAKPIEPEQMEFDAEFQATEFADLDREESGWQEWVKHKPTPGPKVGPLEFIPPTVPEDKREPSRVAEFLPPELRPFLEKMAGPRRREREEAILKKVGWDGLEILGLSPAALAGKAEAKAREYAKRWPDKDSVGEPMNMESEHRKGRAEKTWRRRLRKQQNAAVLYVESAIGAVGGPATPGRPLYVSDYGLLLHRQHKQRTEEILGDLWLVREDDPSVKIPMLEIDRKARERKAAERRMLIDMNLYRWKTLGWAVCWITITLPGQFVCHSTNEGKRTTEWDPDLGPLEAMAEIQKDFHRVMCMLRERGIRPQGFWNSQPQQSGAPHRHILLAVPTVADARAICDAFRAEFGTRKNEEDGPDRGCTASVIGDDHPKYATRDGKNGSPETAASAARYSARYSTRCETKKKDTDGGEAATGGGDEQERFEDWKRRRRARGHTWLGLDSQRSPIDLWRTMWSNAMRSEYDPDDARMALALRHMRQAKEFIDAAVESRAGGDTETMKWAQDDAAREAWHAAIAVGLWPDSDLDPVESKWLLGETGKRFESMDVADPLPPAPLRENRESVFGETRSVFIGAIGTVERFRLTGRQTTRKLLQIATDMGVSVEMPESGKIRAKDVKHALKAAGFGFSKRPDGSVVGFDRSGEILLKNQHRWVIADTETAKAMAKESETPEWDLKRRQAEEARCNVKAEGKDSKEGKEEGRSAHLSDSPNDPRERGVAPSHEGKEPLG